MACLECTAQIHDLCSEFVPIVGTGYVQCCCADTTTNGESAEKVGSSLAETLRENLRAGGSLRDVLSTGRKRAALAKPFIEGSICEWAKLKYAGGGVEPIVGCKGNLLYQDRGKYARHHGPDKNVLNNDPANLHLICPTCHNRWHTLNDKYYGDGTGASRPEAGETWLPNIEWKLHDSETLATATDIFNNEIMWQELKLERKVQANGKEPSTAGTTA